MQLGAGAAIALSGALLAAPPCGAFAAEGPCSSDTFVVEGSPVIVRVCDAGVRLAGGGSVSETLVVKGRPTLVRSVHYDRLASDEARTIDDVPLETLGIAKTMHVTLAIRGGAARIEHVLLVPGALSLK